MKATTRKFSAVLLSSSGLLTASLAHAHENVPASIQERAYTSPIWYSPAS